MLSFDDVQRFAARAESGCAIGLLFDCSRCRRGFVIIVDSVQSIEGGLTLVHEKCGAHVGWKDVASIRVHSAREVSTFSLATDGVASAAYVTGPVSDVGANVFTRFCDFLQRGGVRLTAIVLAANGFSVQVKGSVQQTNSELLFLAFVKGTKCT